MIKPGERSRERVADFYYSGHEDEKDRYFFKVLVGDFRERLAVPDKFVQHFTRGLVTSSVTLESRCGRSFHVQVAENLGKVVLQAGWKEFVAAHGLSMGDVLVFKHDGTPRLKVFMFDHSCCEKVPPPCPVKIKREHHVCGGERRETHPEVPSSSCGDASMTFVTASSSSASPSDDASGEWILSPEDQKPRYVPGYILPNGTYYLTCVQMQKLKERVRARTSTIPIYGCTVRKSNIRRGSQNMAIPRAYADVYLPFEDRTLTLQRCGESWEVQCRIQKGRRGCKRLAQGWRQFAHDNKLQLGDLCLFELLENTSKYTMDVHVVRAE